jgi:hypothetical protein
MWDHDDEPPEHDDHPEERERVSLRIAGAVIEFCRQNELFHADELRAWVIRETGIAAPASADRILRQLRQRHVIDYVVLSRRESLYQTLRVPQAAPPVVGAGGDAAA